MIDLFHDTTIFARALGLMEWKQYHVTKFAILVLQRDKVGISTSWDFDKVFVIIACCEAFQLEFAIIVFKIKMFRIAIFCCLE